MCKFALARWWLPLHLFEYHFLCPSHPHVSTLLPLLGSYRRRVMIRNERIIFTVSMRGV